MRTNCYVVSAATGDTVVIDPGDEFELIGAAIDRVPGREVHAVLCTHAHFDHLMAATAVSETYGAPLHLHGADRQMLRRANLFHRLLQKGERFPIPDIDVSLEDEMTLSFGALEVRVVHTPGHSPGSVCYELAGGLFTGDTLGPGGPGRTDLPGGDPVALRASVLRLTQEYSAGTVVHAGHGPQILLGDLEGGLRAREGQKKGGQGVKKSRRRGGRPR
jgi:hydroxyacylglutathione hydrolase